MTLAIAALEADRDELLRIGATLDESEWQAKAAAPDGRSRTWSTTWPRCSGPWWTRRFPTRPAFRPGGHQEVFVQARRSLRAAEVLDDYAAVSEKAIAALAGFADADFELALGDFGTYPARVLPLAFCFDHYTHIRADLFAPRRPAVRARACVRTNSDCSPPWTGSRPPSRSRTGLWWTVWPG